MGFYIDTMANKGEALKPKPAIPKPYKPILKGEFSVLNYYSPLIYSVIYLVLILMVPNIPPKPNTKPPIAHPMGLAKGNPIPIAT